MITRYEINSKEQRENDLINVLLDLVEFVEEVYAGKG